MGKYLFFALAVVAFFAEGAQPSGRAAHNRSCEKNGFPPDTNSSDPEPPVAALEGEVQPSQDAQEIMMELSGFGKYGDTIARARGQVLEILQRGNACSAWFQEADHDPIGVFRSLHFELIVSEPSYIYGIRDGDRGHLYMHPWAARSMENGGRNSVIQLNVNGPFFSRTAILMQQKSIGTLAHASGYRQLVISSYTGDTPKAQLTILLHELGHIVGRLPEDDDSWDGRSSRNTLEVLRHCKNAIDVTAHNRSRGGD